MCAWNTHLLYASSHVLGPLQTHLRPTTEVQGGLLTCHGHSWEAGWQQGITGVWKVNACATFNCCRPVSLKGLYLATLSHRVLKG